MKEFVETLIKQLVDKPDKVQVTEKAGEHTIICEVKVGEGDIGKIIGKKGQTAHSIRLLISAVSKKMGKRTVMEIIE